MTLLKPVRRMFLRLAIALFALAICLPVLAAAAAPRVDLVVTEAGSGPAAHGLKALKLALESKGVAVREAASMESAEGPLVVVAGLAPGAGEAAKLARDLRLQPGPGPESLLLHKVDRARRTVWLVAGSDARGLMYALLDLADRVGWAKSAEQPFSEVRDIAEKPYSPERALSVYTMHRAYWESRFYDEAYWARYFDTLARNRFNSFVLIFGYENGGFLAPAYPYFFDVPQFPDVRMAGLPAPEQQRNLAALKRLIGQAHDRGVNVTIGLWDHIYRGGVQSGGIPEARNIPAQPVPGLVWGVTTSNLTAYTCAALEKFLAVVPEVDAIQFRMHDESGLKNSEQTNFWANIFQVMKTHGPKVRFDARAKGLPDSVIENGLELGVNLRVTTKYWMEQMGLPFHPTHINTQDQLNRRHSYADLLRYPQRYKMHWRLWNGGTARVLLWGDPDYARRFAQSARLYDGDGFEVNEPLCTKMEAQPHDAKPFDLLKADSRYYDYEFERYWHFFQVFGRLGYNPDAAPEIWQREFERRFGPDAAPLLEKALHRASQVLPRIVGACYPYGAFPMTRGWAEKQRLGDLPAYARAQGSDLQQFENFDEEAQLLIAGGETPKTRPPTTSRWFSETAAGILAHVEQADRRIGSHRSKEYVSTVTDLKILAQLALFHARRIPAAVEYRLFERTKDPAALEAAIADERKAVGAWSDLVKAAGDVYTGDLMMGVRGASLCGHWRDELAALQGGLEKLESQRRELKPAAVTTKAPAYRPAARPDFDTDLQVVHQPVTRALAGSPLAIAAEIRGGRGVKWARVCYRSVNQYLDFRTLPMKPTGRKDEYLALIPAGEIAPAWDLMYLIEVMDEDGHGRIYPDLNKETPYIVVRLQR